MRIAIVDDLAAERTLLKELLERQLQRRNVQADILEYESSETFLADQTWLTGSFPGKAFRCPACGTTESAKWRWTF